MTDKEVEPYWTKKVRSVLLNRKIIGVRYLTQKEAENLDWSSRAIVLLLDNGVFVYPSMDDEGNDAGALFTTDKDLEVIPVI